VYQGHLLFSVVVTVLVLLLLSFKLSLHRFIKRLTIEEIHAFIQFVIIKRIGPAFLPDRGMGQ
jgi:uncharacterized membrane protein (DUF4010 family)